MRFACSWIRRAPLWIVALGIIFAENADGQENPQWITISDEITSKGAESGKKAPSFEQATAGVAVDPMSGDVYMIVNKQGVWKSTNGGKTFERSDGGKVSGRCETAYSLNANPAGKGLACFVLDGKCAWTSDGGKTWHEMTNVGRNWDFAAVDWSTPDVKNIFAGHHETGGQAFMSSDGGKSWVMLFKDKDFERTGGVGIFDAKTLVYTQKGKGIQRSTDGGATWSKVSDSQPIGRAVQVHKGIAYWLAREGLLVSKNRGETWNLQGKPVAASIGPMIDPRNENRFAAAGIKGIFRSDDGGETWKSVAALPQNFEKMPHDGWFSNIAWDPGRDVFYASRMGMATFRLERGK